MVRPQLTLQSLGRTVQFLKLAQRAANGQHLCWAHPVLSPSARIWPFLGLKCRFSSAGRDCKEKCVLLGERATKINTRCLHKLESGRAHPSRIVLFRLKTALDCTRNALLEGINT